ncbi:Hint domain-containing protein [Nioella sp.]|uniref:Hint domain-containing protein n=1 Tax=Nioella sp. TaxID=1912091 RepID=UPI003B52AEA7
MSTLTAPETPPTGFDSLNPNNAGGDKDLGSGNAYTFTFNLGSTSGGSPYYDDGPYTVTDQGFTGSDPVFIDANAGTFTYTISLSDWVSGGSPSTIRLLFEDDSGLGGFFDLNLTCFAAGTMIATPDGETAVETVQIGDLVSTGTGAAVAVKWIGRQTVMTLFGPAERLMPVRFAAGSLGDGLPHNDLIVTADHGMLVDDVICHAGALVNGTTITRVPLAEMGESYTVYHIETEAHEIILANGAPAETFIDNVSRRAFDNFAEFETLYGDVPEMEELPYPRAMSARQVPVRIVARLGYRLAG